MIVFSSARPFRDVVNELGVPALEHVVPDQPSFPPLDELARVAARHDLRPVGPPMTEEQAQALIAAAVAHLASA